MKTTQIEVREVLGEYDGKIKIYREPDNTLVFETDTATFKIKNGTLYLSGHIVGQNYQLGTPTTPLVLLITDTILTNDVILKQIGNALFGDVGEPGLIKICDASGSFVIILDGTTGHATIKGGLNVGTASGAAPGEGKFSAKVTADIDGFPVIIGDRRVAILGDRCYFSSTLGGDITWRFYSQMSATRTGDAKILVYGSAASAWTNFIQMTHTGDAGHGVISTDLGKIIIQPANQIVEIAGFLSTEGNALLATDLVRHEVTTPEATQGYCDVSWNKTTVDKVCSINASVLTAPAIFMNSLAANLPCSYDPTNIRITFSGYPCVQGDMISLVIVYEK